MFLTCPPVLRRPFYHLSIQFGESLLRKIGRMDWVRVSSLNKTPRTGTRVRQSGKMRLFRPMTMLIGTGCRMPAGWCIVWTWIRR